MDYRGAKFRTRRLVLGREWRIALLGTAVVAAYDLAMLFFGLIWLVDFGLMGYAGGGVGGFVAGALVGTNWEDGVSVGVRAALLGSLVVSIVFVLGSFGFWLWASGTSFFFWSSFLGTIALVVLAPLHLFVGAVGGIAGVLLRRVVLPETYNPPAY